MAEKEKRLDIAYRSRENNFAFTKHSKFDFNWVFFTNSNLKTLLLINNVIHHLSATLHPKIKLFIIYNIFIQV